MIWVSCEEQRTELAARIRGENGSDIEVESVVTKEKMVEARWAEV
jgi:hypothetical protein